MNRTFLSNLIFVLAINFLIKPFYIFGIDRTVQNVVGAEQYGLYFVLFNFCFLFQIINDFGIQNFNNRNIAQHSQLLDKYLPNVLALKFLLAILYLLTVGCFAWMAGYWPKYHHLLIWLAVNYILISMHAYVRSNVAGLGMYRLDSILSVLDKIVMILLLGYFLWAPGWREQFRIEWFIYAQTFSFLVSISVGLLIVGNRLQAWRFRWRPAFLLLILRQSWPYALVIFLMTVYTKIDSVMIEQLLADGQREAGIYASAYRLLDAVNMIGFLFAGLLLPMFAKLIQTKQSVTPLLKLSLQLIWAIAIPTVVICFFFRQEIAILLYDEATIYWGEVLGLLLITFVAVSGTYIFSTLLTARGDLKQMNIVFVVSILLNVLLNYFLIRSDKAAGAAVATILTQFFSLGAQVWLARQSFRFEIPWRLAGKIGAFAVATTIVAAALYNLPYGDWRLRLVGAGLIGLSLGFLFRMIEWREIRQVMVGKEAAPEV